MVFYVVYAASLAILLLHFAGWLENHEMEWALPVAVVALASVNLYEFLW